MKKNLLTKLKLLKNASLNSKNIKTTKQIWKKKLLKEKRELKILQL